MLKSVAVSALYLLAVVSHASANYSDLKQTTVRGSVGFSNFPSTDGERDISNTSPMPLQLNLHYVSQVAGPMCKRVEVIASCN